MLSPDKTKEQSPTPCNPQTAQVAEPRSPASSAADKGQLKPPSRRPDETSLELSTSGATARQKLTRQSKYPLSGPSEYTRASTSLNSPSHNAEPTSDPFPYASRPLRRVGSRTIIVSPSTESCTSGGTPYTFGSSAVSWGTTPRTSTTASASEADFRHGDGDSQRDYFPPAAERNSKHSTSTFDQDSDEELDNESVKFLEAELRKAKIW